MVITLRQEIVNLQNRNENLTLFHLSDIHVKYSQKKLNLIKLLIEERKPDLLVFTGDYFDFPLGSKLFTYFLKEVSQDYTVIFIRGNHDRFYGKKWTNQFDEIDNCFNVENSIFSYKSEKGYHYNFSSWENRDSLPINNKSKNIVLIHNPTKIDSGEVKNINLILAGHLHGGQLILLKTKSGANFPGNLIYRNCVDRKNMQNSTLIVSKGIGDTFPVRINCPREIVEIVIS